MKNKKEYMKQYYAENAEKVKMQQKQYRAENAEKVKMQNKQYYAENAEKRKMQQRQYRAENAEKCRIQYKQYYAENAEKRKMQQRQYRAENAEKVKMQNKQYGRTINGKYNRLISSAKKRGLHVSLSKQDYELLVTNQNCYYCNGALPEAGGGLDRVDSNQGYTIENVVPCCARCNRILGDMSKTEAYAHMRQMLQIYEKKLAQTP